MFNKILVPLDGSELAEGILPYVSNLAKGLGIPVVLLSVIDHDALEVPERMRPESEAIEDAARTGLVAVVERLGNEGVNAEYRLASGKPAEKIAEVAESEGCDLVAMSTHGRSAIGRGILGSVTDKLVHIGHLPILTMTPDRAKDYSKEGVKISRIMVPLDGSPVSESVLPYVEDLASKLSLQIVLVRVLKLVGWVYSEAFPHGSSSDLQSELEADATEYLKGVAGRLAGKGLKVEWKLLSGSPAVAIVDLARETSQDIIAMATHGRSGVTRWVVGSVAEAVVRASGDPVLIIPPK